MKILGICGSPRKGNTEFMLKTVLDAAKSKGAETELILLRQHKLYHCIGCAKCQEKPYKCPLKDSAGKINGKMLKADLIVFGSPTYFDNVTGLFKDFIDRTHPLYPQKTLKGKKAVICTIGAADLASVEKAYDAINAFCIIYEMKIEDYICISKDELKKNHESLKGLGENLVK